MRRRAQHKQKGRGRNFPAVRALALLIGLWGSLWIAGLAGSRIGAYIYDDRYAPEAPYTEEQVESMQRAAPEVGAMAARDLELWRDNVEMGRSVASLEGALAGTILLLAILATGGVVWMWTRERQRLTRGPLDLDDADGV